MTRVKYILAVMVSLLLTVNISFAGHEFDVLTTKGDIKIKKENSTKWESLDKGQKLFSKDQLKLNKGAYLSLVHTNGNPEAVN